MSSKISGGGRWWLSSAMVVLISCGGGGDGSTGPTDDPPEPQPGTISVDNRTPWELEVAWLGQQADGSALINRRSVPSGQVLELQSAPLEPGVQLTLDIVLQVPLEVGPRVRRKAEVTIDGNQVVTVGATADDPFGAEITVAPVL